MSQRAGPESSHPSASPPPADGDVVDWFEPSMRIDPHPALQRYRARSPVHRNDLGCWVLGYEEATRVLHGPGFGRRRERFLETFRASLGEGIAYEYVTRRLSSYSGTEHRRIRDTVSRAFTPRRIEVMRPSITRLAHELLDRVGDSPEFDLDGRFPPSVAIRGPPGQGWPDLADAPRNAHLDGLSRR